MSLDEHNALLEQLLPVFDSEDFEQVLQLLAGHLSPPDRLQLKMAIKQVMAPCHQPVDLRGRVKGQCRPYELHGMTHWMDDVAINTYYRRIKAYNHRYRMGLFNELHNTRNNFRVMHHNNTLADDANSTLCDIHENTLLVQPIRFGNYLFRSESRLQLSTPLELELPGNQQVNGTTQDISSGGAKFRVPSAFNYSLGQTILVRFNELARKTNIPQLVEGVKYRILGVELAENDSFVWLRVRALNQIDTMAKAIAFEQRNSQQRVRKNTDDMVMQARTKGYENCFLKHTPSLPVFFAGEEIQRVLLTAENKKIWQYWHDERNLPVLQHLLNPERIRTLTQPGLNKTSTLVYCFKHQHEGRDYIYSAAQPELSVEQRRLFWHVGAKRDSWRVLRISVFLLNENDYLRMDEAALKLISEYNQLSHVAIIEDLTLQESKTDYLLGRKPNLGSVELNNFIHKRTPIEKDVSYYFDPQPQRSEPRFELATPIVVNLGERGSVKATTIDFSSKGLYVKLDNPVRLSKGDSVSITFSELGKKSTNGPLIGIPYSCVRIAVDGQHVNLMSEDHNHKGHNFLKQLIDKNITRLKQNEEAVSQRELLMVLYQMLLTRLTCVPYYAEKRKKLSLIAAGLNQTNRGLPKLLMQLSEFTGGNERYMHLGPVFKQRFITLAADPMRPIEPARWSCKELYLAITRENEKIVDVTSRLLTDFTSTDERLTFIRDSMRDGQLVVLRVSALPMKGALTMLTSVQLTELAQHAMHRASVLEQEFSALVGFGEMCDVTDEVLTRLEIPMM
uniref:PilZ domain-containing protein n=1 Tax=Thaumasiovibrio occultus TaxID=1891184 RepID=UPI000B355B68|nr:PilZ domain-containing protein [Thaumasiovibrio occultus]